MARTDSEEEIQLRKRARRRLVGAVALVIVSVVILPMVLDSEPKRVVHEIDIQIPSENSVAEFMPKIVPEVAPSMVEELSVRESVEDPRPETPKTEPVDQAKTLLTTPQVIPKTAQTHLQGRVSSRKKALICEHVCGATGSLLRPSQG
jgi:DedD protein